MGEHDKVWSRGWRGAVLIASGIFIGAMLITPAVAHIGSTLSHLYTHTDKRYYKKAQADTLFQKQTSLASGESVSGVFSAGGANSSGAGGYLGVGINYPRPLAAPLPDSNIVDVQSGTSAPHCPGIGQADPGYLCLYDTISSGVDPAYMYSTETDVNGRIGAVVYWPVTGASPYVGGTFTLTAP